jgi:hypothetical protein
MLGLRILGVKLSSRICGVFWIFSPLENSTKIPQQKKTGGLYGNWNGALVGLKTKKGPLLANLLANGPRY